MTEIWKSCLSQPTYLEYKIEWNILYRCLSQSTFAMGSSLTLHISLRIWTGTVLDITKLIWELKLNFTYHCASYSRFELGWLLLLYISFRIWIRTVLCITDDIWDFEIKLSSHYYHIQYFIWYGPWNFWFQWNLIFQVFAIVHLNQDLDWDGPWYHRSHLGVVI